jgi:phosphoribosylformylglycinamidine (FGAM) synthase-like enzyme
LDNFCWGDPLRPETLGTLVEAAKGCHDAAVHYGTPFISGKDSLNNEYYGTDGLRHAIPPTLLISALGLIDDVNMSVTMDLKKAGNLLYLVGEFAPTFGGSHFNLVIGGQEVSENVPGPTRIAPKVYAALHKAICNDLVCSIHDLSEGGLAVAAAEMVIGGRLGLEVNLTAVDSIRMLFGETNGCLLVEVAPENALMFEKKIENLPVLRVATILEKQALVVCNNNQTLFSIPIGDLVKAWSSSR